MERWGYILSIPTFLLDDPEFWEHLNEGDIEPDYSEIETDATVDLPVTADNKRDVA